MSSHLNLKEKQDHASYLQVNCIDIFFEHINLLTPYYLLIILTPYKILLILNCQLNNLILFLWSACKLLHSKN